MLTAQEIWNAAESSAYHGPRNELLARLGEWGMVAPRKENGEPDFDQAEVSHLSTWSKPDF